jgi:hypothetical protein
MTTRVLIPSLLSLAALASPAIAAARGAANRQLAQNEIEIAKAFDSAVRKDASLDSLSKLPWDYGAGIFRPEILGALKSCAPSLAEKIGDTLVLSWNSIADGTRECGRFGYYAQLKLKNGRIKRVLLGEYEIVLTSGTQSNRDR